MAEPPVIQEIVKERFSWLDSHLGTERANGERTSLRQVMQLLNLVHDSRATSLIAARTFDTRTELQSSNLTTVAAGLYRIYFALQCSLDAVDDVGIGVFNGASFVRYAFAAALPVADFLTLNRQVWVGPGEHIRATALGAGTSVLLEGMRLELAVGDYNLWP